MGVGHGTAGEGLFPSRSERLATLEVASNLVPEVSRGRRSDLFLLIRAYELNTLAHDGRCRLTREELADRLNWGRWKVDDVRRLAERLGWIEVDRHPNRSGQGANKVRVAWERIQKRHSTDTNGETKQKAKPESRVSENKRRLSESETRLYTHKNHSQKKEPKEKSPMNHGDGVSKKIYLGKDLERKDLQDVRFLAEKAWPRVVRWLWIQDTELNRLAFVAFACEANRTFFDSPKIEDPIGVFVSVVNDGRLLHREIPDRDDEQARRMLKRLRARPQPRIAESDDTDAQAAASRDRQFADVALLEGIGECPTSPGTRPRDAAAC